MFFLSVSVIFFLIKTRYWNFSTTAQDDTN